MYRTVLFAVCFYSVAGADTLQPGNLEYLGAFRLPDREGFDYSGYGMAYRSDGDPSGGDDGFPGSLYIIGHDQTQLVAEIGIPEPVDSRDVSSLSRAVLLQDFRDISGGMFKSLEIPRSDLVYLPEGDGQLWFCTGQHMQFENSPSLGLAEPEPSDAEPMGPWYAGDLSPYTVNDYMFEIPLEWSDANLPGARLACGRFRDGGWGGLGPSIVAVLSSEMDLPPPYGTLEAVPLVMYGEAAEDCTELETSPDRSMAGYAEADEWSGGAWLTSDSGTAVILVGTKAVGRCWYGYPNGVAYPTSGDPGDHYPAEPAWPYNERGWWSEDRCAGILFFSPEELAGVIHGSLQQWDPQPYAFLDISEFLFDPEIDLIRSRRYLLGACDCDREHGILYVVERRADGERSIVHVFKVN